HPRRVVRRSASFFIQRSISACSTGERTRSPPRSAPPCSGPVAGSSRATGPPDRFVPCAAPARAYVKRRRGEEEKRRLGARHGEENPVQPALRHHCPVRGDVPPRH